MSFFRSLWSGKSGDDDDDDKKPPASAPPLAHARRPAPSAQEAQNAAKKALAENIKAKISLEKSCAQQREKIKSLMNAGQRKAAGELVPPLRESERKLKEKEAQIMTLRRQLNMVEEVASTKLVVEAVDLTTKAARAEMGTMNASQVDEIMSHHADMANDLSEINKALGMGAQSREAYEAELYADDYLDELMREDAAATEEPYLPETPQHVPAASAPPAREPARRQAEYGL